jgi:3-oxoacyl-[acyl-carrier-protein] synthase I
MLPPRAVIAGAGAITSIGYCVPQIWASVRAGMSRYSLPGPMDSNFSPIRMALVSDEDLEPLVPENDNMGISDRQGRMIRLAAPAIREAVEGLSFPVPTPLFLGLPRPMKEAKPQPTAAMVAAIAKQAGVPLDEKASQAFPAGRAAFFLALDQGMRTLAAGRVSFVLVGGVDTHLDIRLLEVLDSEKRLLGEHVSDGFVPGEGAGFLVLARPNTTSKKPSSFVAGVGLANDPGHRYGHEPAHGEGLWNAMNALFRSSPLGNVKIPSTLAGLNGENFGAKEWGIARLRHKACFTDPGRFEHPADCYGDIGAATGGILATLAHAALMNRHRKGPMLIWASSDHEERGCALVDSNKP